MASIPNPRVIGVPWYRREDYERLLQEPDTDLVDSFEDWKKFAEETFDRLVAEGVPLEKVAIDADELIQFARETNNGKINAAIREQFVSIAVAKKYGRGH